ncbi:MAG: hypothetical protein PVJ76_03425 [Gemmatimonadota bacterium]
MRYAKPTALLLAVGVLFAGCEGLRKEKLDVQTFNLQHRSGYEAAELIAPYVFGDREEFPGDMSATDEAITVRETRDNLEKIGRVLEEFDVEIPGIRLHFQLIEADSFRDEDPSIAEVVEELRSLFRFEGYRLLGEAMAPVAGGYQGQQQFSQRFLGVEYPITIEAAARVMANGLVRLDPVVLSDPWDDLLTATVNIRPGQTLVIGGTQGRTELVEGRPTGESTLVLTVRAERD